MINKKIIKNIKLVATDIDGVWTDAKMYYTDSGEYMKGFSTYDGMATSYLLKYNFIVVMITSEYENIEILKTRAKKLGIKEIYYNEKDKLSRIKYLSSKYNISLNNIAYIGDDLNDLEALKFAGLSASPNGAPILNYYQPDVITSRKGGDGAFRDLTDLIFKANNIDPIY